MREAYQQFLPDARAVPAGTLLPYRLDPDLALANIKRGVQVIAAYRDEIAKHLPKIDVAELESLASLALATAEDCVALAQVFRDGGKALEGKHSADTGTIEKAAAVGSWLLQHLRPAGAPAQRRPHPRPRYRPGSDEGPQAGSRQRA